MLENTVAVSGHQITGENNLFQVYVSVCVLSCIFHLYNFAIFIQWMNRKWCVSFESHVERHSDSIKVSNTSYINIKTLAHALSACSRSQHNTKYQHHNIFVRGKKKGERKRTK